ncbi:MAG: hypothetical protein M5U28_38290 [Sandaracinaceae bacterium]|nr:hypothetical protein [Sandaracinaceae bacterium]
MSGAWRIFCDDAELAVECARAAATLHLAVEPQIAEDAVDRARASLDRSARVAVAVLRAPARRR